MQHVDSGPGDYIINVFDSASASASPSSAANYDRKSSVDVSNPFQRKPAAARFDRSKSSSDLTSL